MKQYVTGWRCPSDVGCGQEFDEPHRGEDGFAECPGCGSTYILPVKSDKPMTKAARRKKRRAGQMKLFENEGGS